MDDHERALWLAERAGCLTASRMAEAMKYLKGGGESADRSNLRDELLAERLTGHTVRHYVSPEMQWGLDHEDEAIEEYETRTGTLIVRPAPYAAFVPHPSVEFLGASPDGFIGRIALAEVKCPTTATHLRYLAMAEAPEDYRPQMTLQLICTGRVWCEFISFDPRIQQPKLRLVARRWEPDKDYREKVFTEAVKFLAELDSAFEILTGQA